MGDGTARPCAGLRVVTTANALPAAIVGQVLADAGAEVWLLEPPGGSRLRSHPAWEFWARGQHSLCVDLTRDDDRARARALIDRSDVFVDGWAHRRRRPARARRRRPPRRRTPRSSTRASARSATTPASRR